ncbi:MAG: hypothetical protein ACTIC1_12810 [Brevibacterium sp.]
MLSSALLAELITMFDRCEIDARGGFAKSIALGYRDCPGELTVSEHGEVIRITGTIIDEMLGNGGAN